MKTLTTLLIGAALIGVCAAGACLEASAQGSRKDDIVLNSRGLPAAGVNVAVCAQPANTSTTPCSPLANLFSNPQLTQALVNPLTTDGLGNYNFYAAPGKYTIQIYGPTVTTKVLSDVVLPNDPSAPSFSTVTTTGGISALSLTLTGNLTVQGSAAVTLGFSAPTMTLANQASAPAAPSPGSLIFYSKSADKNLYFKDETSREVGPIGGGKLCLASMQPGATADAQILACQNALPASGGTVSWDLQGTQTISSDVFAAVAKPIHHVISSGTYTFNQTTIFPANMTLEFKQGALFKTGGNFNIFQDSPQYAGNYQIYDTSAGGNFWPAGEVSTGHLNVMWWGAKCDGVTDDTAAILAASTVARGQRPGPHGGSGPGTVVFPAAEGMTIAGIGNSALISTPLAIPAAGVGKNLLVWRLRGGLTVQRTITLANDFAIIGEPSSGGPVVDTGQAMNQAPQVIIYGRSTLGITPLFTGNVTNFYLEKVTIIAQGGFTGDVFVCDYCVGLTFRDVVAGNNQPSAIYRIKGGFNHRWFGGVTLPDGTMKSFNLASGPSGISRSGNVVTVTLAALKTATVTATAMAGGLATYTASNTFSFGDVVTVTGTSNGGGVFNVTNAAVSSASSTSFTIQINGANVTSASDAGTANQQSMIRVADYVTLAGITDTTNFPAPFSLVVQSVVSNTQFTAYWNGANASSGGGTVTGVFGSGPFEFVPATTGSAGAMPGFFSIQSHTVDGPKGIHVETTGAATSGSGVILKDMLFQAPGISVGSSPLSITGNTLNILPGATIENVGMSDYANACMPLVTVVSTVGPTANPTSGWWLRAVGVDNPCSPYFAGTQAAPGSGKVTVVKGVVIEGLVGSTIGEILGLPEGTYQVIGENGVYNNTLNTLNYYTHQHVSGYNATTNSYPVYVEMLPPSNLAGSLAAGGSLTVGQAYTWTVVAVDDAGNETGILPDSSNVHLTPTTGNQTASLSWTASFGAVSYNIYRSASSTFPSSGLGTTKYNTALTSFSDTGAAGTTGFGPPNFNAASVSRLDRNGFSGPAAKLGDGATFSSSPRTVYAAFLPGPLTATWTGATLTLDRAITVTRMQVQAKTAPAGCATNAVVRLSDGTSNVNVTLSAAANDSGAIAQNYAAGAALTLAVQTAAAGCTTSPADANVIVQFRMQ